MTFVGELLEWNDLEKNWDTPQKKKTRTKISITNCDIHFMISKGVRGNGLGQGVKYFDKKILKHK